MMPSAETRLVFRVADPSCAADEVRALAARVTDWPRVVALAEREIATLPLRAALRAAAVDVPPEVEAVLRRTAMARELAAQRLSQRAQRTVRLLHARGIPVMLLKGAATGALEDPTFRARPMGDLDLLVHDSDAPRAAEAVIESGWPLTTDARLLELLKDAHHLPHFIDPQLPGSRLELHVRLLPADHPFSFGQDDLWATARAAPAPFEGAVLPAAESLVLHAAIHFAWQHTISWGAWRTFRSVAGAVARPDFDWGRLVTAARTARAGTCCYWTLRLARVLSGLRVPADALEAVAPPTPSVVLASLERHFIARIAPGEGPACPSVRLARTLWIAALRPRWSGHPAPGRWDPENRWARVHGYASTESRGARLRRHLQGYRSWWRFLAGTLLSPSRGASGESSSA